MKIVDWIHLAQDKYKLGAQANTVPENLGKLLII
jgi:hypothetical protein